MKPGTLGMILLAGISRLSLAQPAESLPKFAAADVHVSAPTANPNSPVWTAPIHDGRYEVKYATMVELIRMAYGVTPDKILVGPNWLELDRFDVIAKTPPQTTPEALQQMLQALLAERFHLAVHKDTRSLPAYALVAGKKPLLREAKGTEDSGCKRKADEAIAGGMTIKMGPAVAEAMGLPSTLHLGPGGTLEYDCRNMTMAAFAENLPAIARSSVGSNPVMDATGLTGKWNFEIRVSYLSGPDSGDRITIFDAVEKQLGLKLEEKPVPQTVILVDRADRTPIANPPGTAEVLPPTPTPSQFEVASVKPGTPDQPFRNRFQMQAGGHLVVQEVTMALLLNRAFNTRSNEEIANMPAWAATEHYNIDAKTPVPPTPGPVDYEWLGPMLRSLLTERFQLKYHTENQPVTAYALVAAKPKLKKADPASRIWCKFSSTPSAPGSRVMTCQNTTMAQLAERMQGMAPELTWPVADTTELPGGWDFTLIWSQNMGPGRGGRGGDAAEPAASEPSGAMTMFEAVDKQLGLKLEKQKRPMPVIVIDRLEAKPIEN